MKKPSSRRKRPSVTQIESAPREAAGVPSAAAGYLSVRLGADIEPDIVREAIARSPRLLQCAADGTERLLDLGQMLIVEQILRGDLSAAVYYLSRRGAACDWGEV